MTRTDAIDWINRLIVTMKEETSGDFPEPKYMEVMLEHLWNDDADEESEDKE